MAGIRFVSIATFYIYRRVLPVDNVSWWWWRYTLLISTLLPGNTVPNCRNLASPIHTLHPLHQLPLCFSCSSTAATADTIAYKVAFSLMTKRMHRVQLPQRRVEGKVRCPSPLLSFFHALFSLLHLPPSALRYYKGVSTCSQLPAIAKDGNQIFNFEGKYVLFFFIAVT